MAIISIINGGLCMCSGGDDVKIDRHPVGRRKIFLLSGFYLSKIN